MGQARRPRHTARNRVAGPEWSWSCRVASTSQVNPAVCNIFARESGRPADVPPAPRSPVTPRMRRPPSPSPSPSPRCRRRRHRRSADSRAPPIARSLGSRPCPLSFSSPPRPIRRRRRRRGRRAFHGRAYHRLCDDRRGLAWHDGGAAIVHRARGPRRVPTNRPAARGPALIRALFRLARSCAITFLAAASQCARRAPAALSLVPSRAPPPRSLCPVASARRCAPPDRPQAAVWSERWWPPRIDPPTVSRRLQRVDSPSHPQPPSAVGRLALPPARPAARRSIHILEPPGRPSPPS